VHVERIGDDIWIGGDVHGVVRGEITI
jgi:hypothetical protein